MGPQLQQTQSNVTRQTTRSITAVGQQWKRAQRCTRVLRAQERAAGSSATQQLAKDWLDTDQPLMWQGSEDEALMPESPVNDLPAPWKMMLLSDGSVTRHLQLLTGRPVTVDCLQMEQLSGSQLHQPPSKALEIPGPLVQRQVLLRCGDPTAAAGAAAATSPPLVYAASWWAGATVDRYLADRALPIWVSLGRGHLELFREIQLVQLGHCPELEQHFGCAGPFWGRQYYFWHQGSPLTLIHEVFSNSLQQYLGPCSSGGSGANGSGSSIHVHDGSSGGGGSSNGGSS